MRETLLKRKRHKIQGCPLVELNECVFNSAGGFLVFQCLVRNLVGFESMQIIQDAHNHCSIEVAVFMGSGVL